MAKPVDSVNTDAEGGFTDFCCSLPEGLGDLASTGHPSSRSPGGLSAQATFALREAGKSNVDGIQSGFNGWQQDAPWNWNFAV